MAEAWGVPPWVIEDEASLEWAERFVAYRTALGRRQKRDIEQYRSASSGDTIETTDLLA